MWQSLVLVLVSFIPFEKQGGTLFLCGNFVFLGVVIIVNINVMTGTNSHTLISLFFQIGSIIVTLIAAFLLNLFTFTKLFGASVRQFSSLEFYYILLLMLLGIISIDIGLNYINRKVRERMIKIARNIRKKIKNFTHKRSLESRKTRKKSHKNLHTGFAFAQEPGHAPQIMDRIKHVTERRKSVRYTVRRKIAPSEGTDCLSRSTASIPLQNKSSKNSKTAEMMF